MQIGLAVRLLSFVVHRQIVMPSLFAQFVLQGRLRLMPRNYGYCFLNCGHLFRFQTVSLRQQDQQQFGGLSDIYLQKLFC